jgi:amino acid adenylation domain-containing protein
VQQAGTPGSRAGANGTFVRTAAGFVGELPARSPTIARDRCVHLIVEEVARRTPQAPAVSCGDRSISYALLASRAGALSTRLRELGVGSGTVVGVCLDRSIDAVAAILAVLKSGGAYAPLDPGYPQDRLDYIVRDAGLRVVVTSRLHSALFTQPGVERVIVEDLKTSPSDGHETVAGAALDDLAYVIYTSGSTGRPKGVMVTHRNLAHSTAARFEYYRDPVRAYLLLSSFAFDSSVAGLFWTLCGGGRLVLPADAEARDPARLAATIDREEVSHLLALPSLYRLILDQLGPASLASLRTVIVAGEACPVALVTDHRRLLPAARFFNEYGPTEATVWCTVHEVTGDPAGPRVPIGRPIPRTRCHIVGADGQLAPVGETGELLVGGDGVTRGYLNRPELTAERFVADGFGVPAERLYRTGDLARSLPDGSIEFLGRIDHQVKVRGHRVELGEIEATLALHPAVKDAVVVARPSTTDGLRLVAYVVPRSAPGPSVSSLRAFVADRLPEFMLPAAFVSVTEFPQSANGKVDREALPAPGRERPDLQQTYGPPRTPLEQWIVQSWAEILDLDQVGIHDPFFELGGSSIAAAQFVNRLQETLGEFVFVVLVFECPTAAGLAARLRRDYASAVARVFGESAPRSFANQPDGAVDEAMIARARRLVESGRRPPRPAAALRNPPALFILSPPRSGTTLLTAMLAGHPQLFPGSELNLLEFDTLGERRATFEGAKSHFLDGAIRLAMEVYGETADEATARLGRAEASNLAVGELYGELQRAIAPRLLLDKSPAYGLNPAALQRAEQLFDQPLYVHLSRDPRAMIRSFADHHMDQVYFNHDGFTPRQAGELVWTLTHSNVLAFLAGIRGRHVRVRYEDLVTVPEKVMGAICAALDLPFDLELLRPYRDQDRKIPGGARPDSKSLGDPKFHAFSSIVTERAATGDGEAVWPLGPTTVALARELGYDVERHDASLHRQTGEVRVAAERARQTRDRLDRTRLHRRMRTPLPSPSTP